MFCGSFVLVTTTLLVAVTVALPQSRGRVRYDPDSDWTQNEARNIRYVHFEPAQLSEVQRNIGFAGAGANYEVNNVQPRVVDEVEVEEAVKPKPAPVRKAFETTKKPFETAKSKNRILTLTAAIGSTDLKESTTPVSIEEPIRPLVNINARTRGAVSRPIPLRNVARNEVSTTTTTTTEVTESTKKPYAPFRTKVNKLEPVRRATTTTTAATTTPETAEENATVVPEEIVATTLPIVVQ